MSNNKPFDTLYMLLTIILMLFILIAVNLLLLKFSCNKTTNANKNNKKPIILKTLNNTELNQIPLAPTGS